MVWLLAVLCGLAAVGLGVVAAVADLDTADQVASVAGSVAGLVGLALSCYTLLRPSAAGSQGAVATAAGTRSVAAGGSVGRAVTGDRATLTTPPVTPPPAAGTSGSAQAMGERGVAAAGGIGEAITGDDARA
ncbi:hypothetical protein [Streptomyces longwoodensis]|uniref:hypothetical protein n=1 Tax=Streptomyces longwoodensis TaxID=68231 RepID=UPI00099F1E79|nr:hypothetical protein [Streptomyces longwoodensis]